MSAQNVSIVAAVSAILSGWTKGQGNTSNLWESWAYTDSTTIHAHGKDFVISEAMQKAKLLQLLSANKMDSAGMEAMAKGYLSTAHERAHKGSESTKALPPTTNAARVKSAEEYRQDVVREFGLALDYMGLFLAIQALKAKGDKATRKDYLDFASSLETMLFPEDKQAVYVDRLDQEEKDKKQFEGLISLGVVNITRGEKPNTLIGYVPAVKIDAVMSGLAANRCKLLGSTPDSIDGNFHLKITLEQSAQAVESVV